jgi:Activator of Hsp90 ATPase homolog 1-like protein
MKSTYTYIQLLPILIAMGCGLQNQNNNNVQTENKINVNKMENQNYTSTIVVDKPISEAFKSIQNYRGWWSEEIEGNTNVLGDTFFYHYKDVHLCKIKLEEVEVNKKLVYRVTENEFNFTKDKKEWVNTQLVFELTTENDKTKIVFTHIGLVPEYECYAVCNDAWTSYIQGSLKEYIETGKGNPNGKEGGLNAELVEKWGLPKK